MKPTELLTAMTKFRPEEDHPFSAYHFLQLLPHARLARDDCKNIHTHG
jgi:hypothetical protein